MNEAQTELELIDPALKQAGWGVVEGSKIKKQFPISQGRLLVGGKKSQPLKADYVLQYKHRNVAVIEAKSDEKHYTEGVGQAKDYAQRLHIRYTYSTNGLQIYQMDMDKGEEEDVFKYPTPDELWERVYGEENHAEPEVAQWRDTLHSVPFQTKSGTWSPRYYQEVAISKVLEGIAKGQKRMLLTLATGTGKTAIAFQIVWKLFQTKWNLRRDGKRVPRILFLADRNILANQAFNAFSAFDEDALVRITPSDIKKKGKVPKNGSIFFTIFQTFMSGEDGSPYFGEYPADYFDLIVIDECHRGGANDESSWRDIMNYFSPAVQVGLTATPKRTQNANTYKYFGDPVYVYSLKEGINDGFLTPFKVKQISTTIDEYIYTEDDEVLQGEIEEGKVYTQQEMNRVIQIMAAEEYKVKLLLSMMDQSQKTIVFCATQIHALAIRDLLNRHSKSTNPQYCARVTADEAKIGDQNLKYFQDNEKTIPTILTTSQKLSTGVDAPELRNVVLMRPVNSMIEFKQIIGRGTRLFSGKDYFTLYDYVGAHKHFLDPEWDGDPVACEVCGHIECTCDPAQPCDVCGELICICPPKPCSKCHKTPCECEVEESEPCEECGYHPCRCYPKPQMVKVALAEGKVYELDSMVKTSFYSADGKPISANEFLEGMFQKLPAFFKNEDELRAIWSKPETRKGLLEKLEESGLSHAQLIEFAKVIHAEDSDLYDVLAHVAFQTNPVKRSERAEYVKSHFSQYESKQRVFIDFVLMQYVDSGITNLQEDRLPELLTLKYQALADAKHELGDINSIRDTFIGFQEYLYTIEE
jgi:type I restriction enzyme, R subunit